MSVPLLRQARLAQSISVARRSVCQCRAYSALATQPRHDPEQDSVPVAGPSRADASAPGVLKPQLDTESLEPYSRVQSYLASINAAGIQPTLQDLEQCKPVERPQPHSPQYPTIYNDLISSLCRSFTKEQLRKFLVEAIGTSRHCATNRKKVDYAESILNQLWKWPTLSELEKAKRDRTEVVNKMLPMTSSQLFLILGRDGADLLRMSQDYDVHISLRQKPMALRVEGTRGAVREVAAHIMSMKQTFIEEEFDLPTPTPIPADMVQRISRLAQAYLENVSSSLGKVRICAKDTHGLEAAKRLAGRAVHEIGQVSLIPLLTHLPAGTAAHSVEPLVLYPHSYAFYPYFSPRSLPFTMNTSGAFRLRRVGEWLKSGYEEDVNSTGGLAAEHGHILTQSEASVRLKDALLTALSESLEPSRTVVTASLGHLLLTRVSMDQRATLVPPLTGDHPFGKIRKWISSSPVKMSFVPDLPLPLLSTAPVHQRVIHRLVYHSIISEPSTHDLPVSMHRRKVISFEATLAEPKDAKPDDLQHGSGPLQSPHEESQEPAEPSALIVSHVHCSTGVQADLSLMMPDRPMDLQFTVSNMADFQEAQQPAGLKDYVQRLRAFLSGSESQPEQPTPPFIIDHRGEKYLLHSNVSARQSVEKITSSSQPSLRGLTYESPDVTQALCESTLDLESNQRSMHCQVTCTDASTEGTWRRFLRDCDRLSLMSHKSATIASLLDKSNPIL